MKVVVLPDRRAVVVRTPGMRSLAFASLADAEAWLARYEPAWTVVAALALAGGAIKLFAPDAWELVGLGTVFALGFAALGGIELRARRNGPSGTPLSWEESVVLDDQPVPARSIAEPLGLSVVLLAFGAGLSGFADWPDLWRDAPGNALVAAGFVGMLAVAGALLGWTGLNALRCRAVRARLRGP